MRRDLELIRKMVLAIEDDPSGYAPKLSFEGYTSEQVDYHAYLLVDGHLANGVDTTTMGSKSPSFIITTLTWAGHEFADAARDDNYWNNAMRCVKEHGGSITIDLLKQFLQIFIKAGLGIA